jgi:single-stranded DNA-binding protein
VTRNNPSRLIGNLGAETDVSAIRLRAVTKVLPTCSTVRDFGSTNDRNDTSFARVKSFSERYRSMFDVRQRRLNVSYYKV